MTWTINHIEKLRQSGKIKGFEIVGKTEPAPAAPIASTGKEKIDVFLVAACKAAGLRLTREHRFHEKRKFRFDWAIEEKMIAVEWEGIFSKKSRHTTVEGFSTDCDKYNLAASMGWRVIRATALNYENVIQLLKSML